MNPDNLRVGLEFFTRRPIDSNDDVVQFFETMHDLVPALIPTRFDSAEPERITFEYSRRKSLLKDWRGAIYWKREKPWAAGGMRYRVAGSSKPFELFGRISLRTLAGNIDECALTEFFRRISIQLEVDLALMHLLTPSEVKRGSRLRTVVRHDPRGRNADLIVVVRHLTKGLPDHFWGMVFGPGYTEFIGKDKLLSAPASVAMELAPGYIYRQLVPSFDALSSDPDGFDSLREAARLAIGSEFFNDPTAANRSVSIPPFLPKSSVNFQSAV
jgi:hypothetical protein